MQIAVRTDKINNSTYTQTIEDDIKKKEIEFNESMRNFLRGFTLRQQQQGLVTDEHRSQILDKDNFNQEDIIEVYENLNQVAIKCIQTKVETKKKDSIENKKISNKNRKVSSFLYISDKGTKSDLCNLYGIIDDDNTDILAIRSYIDDETNVISKGKKLLVEQRDGILTTEKELETISYGKILLSFYIGSDGKMCIARNIDGKVFDIVTDSPQHEDNKKDEGKKQTEETNINEIQNLDLSNPESAERMRAIIRERMKKRNSAYSEIEVNQELKKLSKIVEMMDKIRAENQEKSDKKGSITNKNIDDKNT